jgi:ParB family chromosome partitioning protein
MVKGKSKGLGSGLDTLLTEGGKTELFSNAPKIVNDGKPLLVNITNIEKNPYQPREKFPQDEILQLAASIKDKGIIEPLVVMKVGDKYQLIAGHRRLMAAKHAKLDKVPVIVNDQNTEPIDQLEIALVENMLRQNLNPIEEAKAFERLSREFSKTSASIADVVKKDRSTVENSMRLLRLPDEVKTEIEMGRLTAGHGKALLSLESSPDLLLKAKNEILTNKLTVRQTESLVKKITKPAKDEKGDINPQSDSEKEKDYYNTIINKISEALGGLKVALNYIGKNKKIEITYKTLEDMELILSKLNIEID